MSCPLFALDFLLSFLLNRLKQVYSIFKYKLYAAIQTMYLYLVCVQVIQPIIPSHQIHHRGRSRNLNFTLPRICLPIV
jgi:hypothetical protein